MIITQEKSKRVVQSHDFDSVNCTIDAEDMRYVASLLRNNYSNPPLAVVREISANALDANMEAGSSRKVEVTVPSQLNAHFVVRDFGGGLSPEDVFGLYSKYGKSTKRTSNNYIGAFGIGKFAPLSYGDNFTVVSYHGGVKTSYNVFVNEDDDTKIVKLHEEASDAPTGLSVEVAVADEDVDTFRDVVKTFFRFFPEKDMPKFIGVGEDEKFFEDYEVIMEGKDKGWFIIEDKMEHHWGSHHESHAIMGRVHYPLSAGSVNFDLLEGDDGEESEISPDHLRQLASQQNLYIRFDIGELKLHHSRESLEYNKHTQKEILKTLRKVRVEIEEIAKEKLGDAEDLWDAKVKYAQVLNALPYGLKSIFRDSFEWDGIKINSPSIDRSYHFQDTVTIREYRKSKDADATNGFKVTSSQSTKIYPQVNSLLVIQDLKTTYGNSLRARTLFNDDENLEVIYCVHWCDEGSDGADAWTHVYDVDGMGFSKIKKERLITFSEIEKAKLQSKGKAIAGESRGDVPLFELDVEDENRWKRRNMDFWLNCTEKIDELEEGDAELIYVPISNYKVVDQKASGQEETVTLDSLLRDAKGVRSIQRSLHEKNGAVEDKGDFKFPAIYGIRRKDCAKLTKNRWISFDDYKKRFAKDYLVERHDMIVSSEKAMAFQDQRFELTHYQKVNNLLDNPNFRKIVEKSEKMYDHPLLLGILGDMKLMSTDEEDDTSELQTIYRLVNFLKKVDEEWVKENIPSNYDPQDFDNKCKEFLMKYPLIENLAKQVYSWQNLDEDNFGKNIVDYIFLCDLVGEAD